MKHRIKISSLTHNLGEVIEWCEQNVGIETPTDPEFN